VVSATSAALVLRPAAVTVESPPRYAAAAIVAAGGVLLLSAVALTLLVDAHDVPAAGHPGTWHQLTRLVAITPLLPLGALMLARVPGNAIGWLLSATALGTALSVVEQEYATYSHFVDRLPAESWIGWAGQWAPGPILALVTVAPLLFPTGHLPSRRWRPALWVGIAAPVLVGLQALLGPSEDLKWIGNPLVSSRTLHDVSDAGGIGWFLMLPAAGAGIAALVVRRRSATAETGEQLRLLLRATVGVTIAFAACLVGSFVAPRALDVGASAAFLSLGFLAATMGVAILRHRLYGLDVHVNRALVYSSLTLVLGGLYVAAVLGFGRLLGQDVGLGVALPATALVAVAFNPARDRLQRSVNRLLHGRRDEPYAAISALGRRLGEAMAPDEVLPAMVETIAEALRLPYVAVELTGEAVEPAAAHGTPAAGVALRLPLVHSGEQVGTIVLGARAHGEALGEADRRLLEDFARHAGAAASAVVLSSEVQRSRERLVSAREEERRRLSGDLHDGLGPTLAGAVLTIEAARRMLTRDPARVDELLDRVAASIESTVADVRRLLYGLRPPALDQLGLVGALRQQAAALSTEGESRFSCLVEAPDPMPALPAAVVVAAFRIAQEALTNVARHAQARTASVVITVDTVLGLEIRDDGRGLPEFPHAGVGLTSMRERTAELGGSFELDSTPGAGTTVRLRLPLATNPGSDG
jgi:two-component system NarL family sensor kinase